MRKFKSLTALLLVCMIVFSLTVSIAADERVDSAATSGVDAVVVLDMTNSMNGAYGSKSANDPKNYRLDAAAMLIGMMDMDGSRVAIVPFAMEPIYVTELTDVSTYPHRNALLQDIYKLSEKVKTYTNIGAALMRANKILMDRKDKSNRPMIVLLTDGQNQVTNSSTINSLRWENGNIVSKKEEYTTQTANNVTREAVDCAAQNGIPIYTIALTVDPDYSENGAMTLRGISQATGVQDGCWAVNNDNVSSLPEFFAKVLAKEIGSSVQYSAKPEYVKDIDKTTKQYQVKIPILNQSIHETNIILPVNDNSNYKRNSGIDASTIKLLDSTGAVQNEVTGTTILANRQSHFAMVKVREPKATGLWTLQFNSTKDPSDISFNILYAYDIKLQASVETGTPAETIYKTDRLKLTARFIDSQGAASLDKALYEDHTNEKGYEPWMTITGGWKLLELDANGAVISTPVKQGNLSVDTVRQVFSSTIDLRDNALKSGDYMLVISVSGAGLDRSIQIPLTLKNHAPKAENYYYTFEVNSTEPDKEATWTVAGSSSVLPMRADQIVTDADNDKLEFSLVPNDNSDNLVKLQLNADNSISYQTTLLPKSEKNDQEKIASGIAHYTLHYDDKDDYLGRGSVELTIAITSGVDDMLAMYTPEFKTKGTNTKTSNTEYLKNTPFEMIVRLKDTSGGYCPQERLETIPAMVTILDTVTGEYVARNAAMQINGDQLVFAVDSVGNKAANWDVTVSVAPFEDMHFTMSVPNHEAPAAAAAKGTQRINCGAEKLPSFMGFLIKDDNTEEDSASRIIDIASYFSDADNDILSYSEPRIYEGEEDVTGTKVVLTPLGENQWRMDPSTESTTMLAPSYGVQLRVSAADGDGQTSEYVQNFMIVDLFNKALFKVLIFACALIVLIIIILIIHQIAKPKFPKLNLVVKEEPSMYEGDPISLPPIKKARNLSQCGLDHSVVERLGIHDEQIQNIILKPMRSGSAVKVQIKKKDGSASIALDNRELQKGKTIWRVGSEMAIRADGNINGIVIRLADKTDSPDTGTENWDGDTDWINETSPAPSKSRRKASARKKKADVQPSQDDSFGGSDDMDF